MGYELPETFGPHSHTSVSYGTLAVVTSGNVCP
jgi:hypothetical protein